MAFNYFNLIKPTWNEAKTEISTNKKNKSTFNAERWHSLIRTGRIVAQRSVAEAPKLCGILRDFLGCFGILEAFIQSWKMKLEFAGCHGVKCSVIETSRLFLIAGDVSGFLRILEDPWGCCGIFWTLWRIPWRDSNVIELPKWWDTSTRSIDAVSRFWLNENKWIQFHRDSSGSFGILLGSFWMILVNWRLFSWDSYHLMSGLVTSR